MTPQGLSRWFAGLGRGGAIPDKPASVAYGATVRGMVDSLPIVMFELDAAGLYTCVAGGLISLFGIRGDQLVGRSIFDYPKFVPGKNLMARRALAGETVSFTGIWPRGRFKVQFVPRRGSDGAVVAVVGVGYELAKPEHNDAYFEQLLEALRQSEARFRVMCDSAPLGICVSDPLWQLGYANAALCDLLGRKPEELLGRRWESVLHPEQASPVQGLRADGVTSQRPRDAGVLRLVHKDGSSVWTSVRLAEMRDDGVLVGYVVTIADVTQEHAARMATDSARLDLRRVIETSPEGIAVLRDSRCLFVNRALVAALGHAHAAQLIGRDLSELIHPDDRAWLRTLGACQSSVASDVGAYELRCLRDDGTYALLEVRVAELDEFDGAPALLLSARDITETKRLRAQLLVSERLSSVGSLAAGVAHEINNPLAAALLHLDWLAAQLNKLGNAEALSEPELRAQLQRLAKPVAEARDAGARVRDIVRDLNVFSRPEGEAQGPVDLTRVLESALRLAWNELRQRAQLVRDWGELPSVRGNEARLGQVLLNLLINAAQAIEEGSPSAHEIRVKARVVSCTHVVVEVCDTGSGIPQESLGRIFDPFFTTKPPGVGTGLGLSICQRLLSSMGGAIEVDSRLGHGSTFRVTLLRADPEPISAARVAIAPTRAASTVRGRLVVIDDDPAMASALEQMLAPEHAVQVFMSARPALAYLQAGANVDVVLCDVMMPDMSGIDFHAELTRSHPELAGRVVFVTGGTLNARARAFLDSVDNARLYKPFDAATLHTLVSRQLVRSAALAT